jgi:uncharacterized iron-regulated membrane protein
MNLQRFVFKTHKWLAVGVGLFTFLWFFSGIVMVMPQLQSARRPAAAGAPRGPQSDAESFRQISVNIPQAIAAAEISAGHALEVQHVVLRTVAGRLVYEIGTAGAGTFLIDAMDASRLVVNEELARQIAARAHSTPVEWASISLVREHSREYKNGPLPVYRFAASDKNASLYFINPETAEIAASSTRLGRLRMLIVQTHTLGFLRPEMQTQTVAKLLVLFAALGLLMSLFGGGILAFQLRNWFEARRRAA